ncbi:ankyrin repeat and SOCS box protein 3-like [Mizuhopecten yessoensis]|uniref:ankyrin repeat and SOCS box protein 3-like n=1 Tax=Mizuhopecten yessoensis TaxID=6573 RepID=UPI000B45D584|nr:ankyrin repeat and SOCS box protein 3-like [Mizuhopecten yessoensis]XP_021372983.1 ankyrin repeat and SOCS box protein 3-like [Mizuhopecten yessoensis]XP_021372984.1 ankyrin repeat and SOCS box protein 3-like [Mizuhopecten yessoensis]
MACAEDGVSLDTIVDILRCIWHCPEDHAIKKLRQHPKVLKEPFGFEYLKDDKVCVCHHILERLQHNGHIFHVNKLCDLILAGSCPHVSENSPVECISRAGTYFITAAAALGKEDVVRYLMIKGSSLDAKTQVLKLAPIHLALMKNDLNMLYFLLAREVEVNVYCEFSEGRFSPLMLAARDGTEETVNLLLDVPDIRLDFLNQSETGALTCALQNKNSNILDILIRAGVQASKTTLEKAVQMNNASTLEKILKTKPLTYFEDVWRVQAIHQAVKQGSSKLLKVLFDKGFSLSLSSAVDRAAVVDTMTRHYSPLHVATLNNDAEMVGVLIDGGVSIDSHKIQDYTAYDLAIAMGFDKVKSVIEAKAGQPLHSCVRYQYGPYNALFYLKGIDRPGMIRQLAAKGYDLDETYQGHTKPIYFAIRSGDHVSLKTLIQLGANPDPQLRKISPGVLDSPLASAVRLGNVEAVKILLSENVRISDQSLFCCKDASIFRLLVDAGADIRKHTKHWQRLYELARLWKVPSIQRFLDQDFDEPQSLSLLCRDTIRYHFHGKALNSFLDHQHLPGSIRRMLTLEDLLSTFSPYY